MARDLTDLTITTLDKSSEKLYDNVLKNNYLLKKLLDKKHIVLVDGGDRIEENLMYAENKTFKWYRGGENLATITNQTLISAYYYWKSANVNIVINGDEKRMNSGSATRKYDLLGSKIKVCEITMRNQIGQALFSTPQEVADTDSKIIEGIPILISDTPGEAGDIVGEIDAHNEKNAFWRNKHIPIANATNIEDTKREFTEIMSLMTMQCSREQERPSMIIMDSVFYNLYKSICIDMKRILDVTKADVGFKVLDYEGIPVYCDTNCPKHHAYFINDDYLFLKVHPDANFKLDKARIPYNQDTMVFPMIFMGTLTCSNRSLQGVVTLANRITNVAFNHPVKQYAMPSSFPLPFSSSPSSSLSSSSSSSSFPSFPLSRRGGLGSGGRGGSESGERGVDGVFGGEGGGGGTSVGRGRGGEGNASSSSSAFSSSTMPYLAPLPPSSSLPLPQSQQPRIDKDGYELDENDERTGERYQIDVHGSAVLDEHGLYVKCSKTAPKVVKHKNKK